MTWVWLGLIAFPLELVEIGGAHVCVWVLTGHL
jgi:hypothetical protein